MKDNFVSVGFTKKTFGTIGELKVKIEDAYLEDVIQAEVLFLDIQKKKVPFFKDNLKLSNTLLLKLEDVNSKETATSLTSKEIFLREKDVLPEAERELEVIDHLEFRKYIGFEISDENFGKIGKIEAVLEYPQQEMAVVVYKEGERLIPMHQDLILKIEPKKKVIFMNLPDGILSL